MKPKSIKFVIILFFCNYLTVWSQTTQMNYWYFSPDQVFFPAPPTAPAVTTIPNSPAIVQSPPTPPVGQQFNVVNGMYDSDGSLLFYIANNNVFDYNNSLIGSITPAITGAEIAIVPFGNNNDAPGICQSKFNIFTVSGGFGAVTLIRSVVDMKSFSVTSDPNPLDFVPITIGAEFGAIAVGNRIAGGDRYMYFMAASGYYPNNEGKIDKLVIKNDGTVDPPAFLFNLNAHSSTQLFSVELDLSPDGKYLAWGGYHGVNGNPYRYHYLELSSSNGNYVPSSYTEFNIDVSGNLIADNGVNGFRGVEFWQTGSIPTITYKLFMGAGADGIYSVDIPLPVSPTFVKVSGSDPDYGFSQIELANNGFMYASKAGTGTTYINAFEPGGLTPTMDPTYSFSLTNNLPKINYGSDFYTLPDQIDGQDYSDIVSTAVQNPILTTGIFIYAPGGAQSWNNVTNPWSNPDPKYITNELRITGNTALTCSLMTFVFSPIARVIVDPGSTLKLDGTTFTSVYVDDPCYVRYTWKGVDVLGISTGNQQAVPQVEGKLILINSSVIEYAECGARAWDGVNNSSTGGIIIANTFSSFKNNKTDVLFKPYINHGGPLGNLLGNLSSFNNTTFSNDQTYPFTSPPEHVIIEGCRGIYFSNCDFANSNTQPMLSMNSIGIKALAGGFMVRNNTQFSHLWHAVDAGTNSANVFSIKDATFTDNTVGVSTLSVNNFVLQSNIFDMGSTSKTIPEAGISMNSCSGFTIEENHFNAAATPLVPLMYGIVVNNAGSANNQIYKNYLQGLDIGNYAMGINRDNSISTIKGLQYLCNENTSNIGYDFVVHNKIAGSQYGIRLSQGTLVTSAGNQFTSSPPNPYTHIYNNTSSPLSYYYKGVGVYLAININNPYVVPLQSTTTNGCPSRICEFCPHQRLSNSEVEQLTSEYTASETAYLNLLYTYNQLMDGGSTNVLLNQIQQSWSSDAQALRDELLALSPYLSQDVLREVAAGDDLPNTMLLLVCMANPDATRDDEFLNFLQYEIEYPLPQYMIDLIVSSWDDGTTRTTMESMLAAYSDDMSTKSTLILNDLYYKSSEVLDSIDVNDTTQFEQQIIFWLNRIQTIQAKYDLIENYFASGEVTLADEVLESIPNDFNLSEDQLEEYEDYSYFYEFRKSVNISGGDFSSLDESEIETLTEFTEGDVNYGKGLAQHLLCFYYGICREDDFELPSGNKPSNTNIAPESIDLYETGDSLSVKVTVVPNPVSDVAVFNYSFPSDKKRVLLSICDLTGKEIIQYKLTDTRGKLIWETGNAKSGLYYYYLKDGHDCIARGKFSVNK